MRNLLAVATLGLVCAAAGARADVVVLEGGRTLQGRVHSTRTHVVVQDGRGRLQIPRARVQDIRRTAAEEPTEPAPTAATPQQPESPAPRAETPGGGDVEPAAAPRGTGSARDGRRGVQRVLQQAVDVDFEAAPLTSVIDYLRQVTGLNIVVHPAVATAQPVTLHLADVEVETVLDVLAETHNFAYDVRYGDILLVAPPRIASLYVRRIYPVHDLLVSYEDVEAAGAGGAYGPVGDDDGPGLGDHDDQDYQFGAPAGRADLNGFGPAEVGEEGGAGEMYYRSLSLIRLMRSTCGPGTWMVSQQPGRPGPR